MMDALMNDGAESSSKPVPGLAAILEGDETGWAEWYTHYLPEIVKMVNLVRIGSIVGIDVAPSRDIACEIATDFFRRSTDMIDELRGFDDERMLAYLFGMARNKKMDLLREKERIGAGTYSYDEEADHSFQMKDLATGYMLGPSTPPDMLYDLTETLELIMDACDSMQPTAATVLKMLMQQSSHKDMARVMGCDVKTVGIKVKRTRQALRTHLATKHPDWVATAA